MKFVGDVSLGQMVAFAMLLDVILEEIISLMIYL